MPVSATLRTFVGYSQGLPDALVRLYLLFSTALTAVQGDQFAPLYIKLLGLIDKPLMVAVAAQSLAFSPVFRRRFTKGEYICHGATGGSDQ